MSKPMNAGPATSDGQKELPAYVSNGLIGLSVRDIPLIAGMALVSGFAGEQPLRQIGAAAPAPYPLAGDIAIAGVWLSDAPIRCVIWEQSYDFSKGELSSKFIFRPLAMPSIAKC
jgi:hypothetical protein